MVVTAWQNGKVFGLSHYKHGPRRVNLGLPAGYLESDEDALAAARRELHEGARLASEIWQHMGLLLYRWESSQARAHFVAAHDCRSVEARPSDEEQMGEWLTPQQWGDYLAGGDVATLGVAMAVHAGILAISN